MSRRSKAAAAKKSGSATSGTAAPRPSRLQADPKPPAATAAAPAAMASFDRLAQVEVQLVMQHCDKVTLLRLARCSRSTLAAALHPFAWRARSPLELKCDSPLELSARIAAPLLRHADFSVVWQAYSVRRGNHGGETQPQLERMAVEAAALAALPGLCHLEVDVSRTHLDPLFRALLARVDDGGAVTSLRIHVFGFADGDVADCAALGQLMARSRTLTTLSVAGRLDPEAARCLADGVSQSQSLTALHLSGMFNQDAATLAAAVARCRSLTDLQLHGCGIDDAGVESLAAALSERDNSILKLSFSGNRFGPGGAAAVARLLTDDRCAIQSLNLSYCSIRDDAAKSLAESLRTNRTLTQLRLDCCRMEAQEMAALVAAVQTNPHIPLRRLDLSENQVDAACAAGLARLLRAKSLLEELNLGECGLGDAAVVLLAVGLPAARPLRELRLDRNLFGANGSSVLAAGVGACPSLTLLDVSQGDRLRDGGMVALVRSLGRLHSFHAGGCRVTHDSAAPLASLLQSSRQLHTLHLDANVLGTAGAVRLAAALDSSSPLRTLHLSACAVDAEGAAALGRALRRGWAVTDLQLGHNQSIGDDGARALASALGQRGRDCCLHTLNLEGCALTGAGALALVHAASVVPSLGSLSLCFNRLILDADKPALQEACGAWSHFQLEL